ncbi:MAG: ABC transporter permease [Mesorhizobium amorphae]|nr:MAG: ABC transporter permease [Mesorhizobium amorphae]
MAILGKTHGRLLLSPLVAFLLLFLGFPALVNLVYSVSAVSFETLRSPSLSGFGNYLAVVQDGEFWRAFSFSLRFGLLTALAECLLGLFLAVFLAPLLSKRPILLAPLMLPLMVAPAMVGLMYRLVLHEFAGPVPFYLFEWFGDSPAFLDPQTAFWTLAVIEVMQWTPFAFLLFYAAYLAIPDALREAAALDGAGAWKILRFIELPLMMPTLVIAFFIRFIDGFRVFDNIYALTGSGAGGSTTSLSIYIYQAFFKEGAIGKAVAASVLLFAASLLFLMGLNRLARLRRR